MSYHYYCWALGYSSDQEFDPALRLVCDDVGVCCILLSMSTPRSRCWDRWCSTQWRRGRRSWGAAPSCSRSSGRAGLT